MAATLQVGLVTPIKQVAQSSVDRVVAPSVCGQVTILPEHAPLLCNLVPGVIELGGGAAAQRYFVSGGFLEVARDRVTILAESAQPTGDINLAAANADLQAAEAELKILPPDDIAYRLASLRAECARQKIQAVR